MKSENTRTYRKHSTKRCPLSYRTNQILRSLRRSQKTHSRYVDPLLLKPDFIKALLIEHTHCACCSKPFDIGRGIHDRSPTLDRILSDLDYTLDNIELICYRCNVLKRDATADELLAITKYMVSRTNALSMLNRLEPFQQREAK